MDSVLKSVIDKLFENGPGFIVAAVFLVLFFWERKRSAELNDRLHKISLASLEADQEHTKMYGSINKALNVLIDIIKREIR